MRWSLLLAPLFCACLDINADPIEVPVGDKPCGSRPANIQWSVSEDSRKNIVMARDEYVKVHTFLVATYAYAKCMEKTYE